MVIHLHEDTIAAVSTPAGEGGIGIVRLSGCSAVKIAREIFILPKGKGLVKFKSRVLNYGYIIDGKKKIDEVLLAVMKAPGTYTREDIVEINCHGGITALRKVLELTLKHGARPAEPGEFTKRAFLKGRLDLSQAEAVLDIIEAKTEAGLRVSLNQLEGELSREVKFARKSIMEICADMEASMDFPEEDITPKTKKAWISGVKDSRRRLEKLLSTYHDGAILKEGIVAVICGRPNVGKSSLLNVLLRKNKAIVTHLPGTTRDPIEEMASIKGIPMRLVDTAGIRKEKGIIEKEGIKRSHLYL
ncbi:MAG: tRNA uridine-5-carboxymethylaminomethyl(34) synthesis GTPase MnmE, partial [Candidatus Omnitrophica bacterium]|nr:tRNA uridine-5-carboxymethylaminomethyl(34) synthesis GTPase MnmE [Candidatus Omnitrophota bacterium]